MEKSSKALESRIVVGVQEERVKLVEEALERQAGEQGGEAGPDVDAREDAELTTRVVREKTAVPSTIDGFK